MSKNILVQFGIILLVTFIGQFAEHLLPFPFPGVIIGFILMFVLLFFKVIKPYQIDRATNVLLTLMAFMFVPAGVKLVGSLGVLREYWWKLLIIIVVSTLVTMTVTAWVVQYSIYYLRHRKNKKLQKRNNN